jgi:hypothetical protein
MDAGAGLHYFENGTSVSARFSDILILCVCIQQQ